MQCIRVKIPPPFSRRISIPDQILFRVFGLASSGFADNGPQFFASMGFGVFRRSIFGSFKGFLSSRNFPLFSSLLGELIDSIVGQN